MFCGTAPVTGCQLEPFAECETVKLPEIPRSNFTQYGAVTPDWLVLKLTPPLEGRPCEATPLTGVIQAKACADSGASDSRIITPALAQPLVLSMLLTFAIIVPAPLSIL